MISCDLHNHTLYSHAKDTVRDMYQSAVSKGLAIFGFSEHSPRPLKYTYPVEYRDRLNAHLQDYVDEVQALKKAGGPCQVLFGMEIDWFEDDIDFVRQASGQFDFDFLIGSTHFLGTWGYDCSPEPWEKMSEEKKFECYTAYFKTWRKMLATGFFQIAAHPDLIKIFSMDSFHSWIVKEESQRLIKDALEVLKSNNMAMEISSAGLRKPCHEIYPCPLIMRLASEVQCQISFASDAHNVDDVAYGFPVLASYARAFGFAHSVYYAEKQCHTLAF